MRHWTLFNPDDVDWQKYSDATTKKKIKKNEKRKNGKTYTKDSDTICTLDIEVSSGWKQSDGTVIGYHAGEDESFWNSMEKVSVPYIWQFSINDVVYYGREWTDFPKFLEKFPKDTHIIIYVHNLGYEFTFMQNLFKFTEVFAREAYKVMYASCDEFPNLEFRCSLFLTRLSLDSWGKKIGLPKRTGDLDYDVIRTPKTPLTVTELGYCERDCQVVFKGIEKYRETYKHIRDIPLTQTGEVRKVLKAKVKADRRLQSLLIGLLPSNADMYLRLTKCFSGGYTHANFKNAGIYFTKEKGNLPDGHGVAYDFTSLYPSVLFAEKYPMSKFFPDTFDFTKINEKCYIMKVEFLDLDAKTQNHYLSASKCESLDNSAIIDNGRIVEAENATIWLTEIDLYIMFMVYKFQYKIKECFSADKGYLPKYVAESVLDFYGNKTKYKDVEGYEDIYMQNKQFLNSIFGCMVMALCQDDCEYDYLSHTWNMSECTKEDIREELIKLKSKNNGRTYCCYAWGVWCTAYGRFWLWTAMQHKYKKDGKTIKIDEHVIYCDTDSLKIDIEVNFDWLDKITAEKMKKACEFHGIPIERTMPKSPDGIERPLGKFSKEENFTEFVTLGAKRYCYRTEKDGVLHLTVSGVNKEAVACLNDDIYNFNEHTVFDKDNKGVNKKLIIHNNEMTPTLWKAGESDEYYSDFRCGITMRPTSYNMTMAAEYTLLLSLSKYMY